MIPGRQVWKTWTPLEKISYSAQFAASLALLPTVFFAYLGWREARLAREDQTEFFLAEKAPRIEIKKISIETGILTVDIHNSGESSARNVSIKNATIITGSKKQTLTFSKLSTELYGDNGRSKIDIAKNETASVFIESSAEIKKQLGFIPWGVKMTDPTRAEMALEGSANFFVIADYQDIKKNNYSVIANALFKPPTYQAQLEKYYKEQAENERSENANPD